MSFQPLDRDLSSIHVLVVDDDPDMRTLLRDMLEHAGYIVGEARDGQAAFDLLRQTPDSWVVLTDQVMPRLDGPGLIAAVVADHQLRTRHAYIYMTAADRDIDPDLQRKLEALHASVLHKPFYTAECVALVASAAERRHLSEEAVKAMTETPRTVNAETLGAAWIGVARHILAEGVAATYDALPILELSHVVLDIAHPSPDDPIIAAHGDPEWLAWMRANFTEYQRVAALGDADSYATRLYDYAHSGRDQIAWVIERLRADPRSRSATITTFQPQTDTTYIPCVSLLDFWIPNGALELIVYAHSIDFGKKGYGNLVELAAVQGRVAAALGRPIGRLVMIVKSAHIYAPEQEYMTAVVAAEHV